MIHKKNKKDVFQTKFHNTQDEKKKKKRDVIIYSSIVVVIFIGIMISLVAYLINDNNDGEVTGAAIGEDNSLVSKGDQLLTEVG